MDQIAPDDRSRGALYARPMLASAFRKLSLVVALICAAHGVARADFGIGPFIGDPTGLDFKIGLAEHSSLDLLFGWFTIRDVGNGTDAGGYGHLTYLVTPVVAHGDSVNVPVRLGIGVAVFGVSNDLNLGVRFPLQVGLRFRRAPLEIYGEIALLLAFVDPAVSFVSGQGGIGIRFYF
jgi:hypothetical protein